MRQFILFLSLLLWSVGAQSQTTVRQQMQRLQALHGLHFVYASDLNLDLPYSGLPLEGLEVKEALRHLFYNQGIRFTKRKNNIILNATGMAPSVSRLAPLGTEGMDSTQAYRLDEVVVNGHHDDRQSSFHGRMGMRTLKADRIGLGFSTLSSPDLLKSIHQTSGVSAGYELGTDFYVHGGSGDENLVLVDGTPLYSTAHTLGVFSTFNTDMIDSVNFYKSNFPARYSGRLSSVTDVSIRDGNAEHFRGSFSIGLLEGRLQAEGPIVKGRTSYNVGIRRSWMDVFTRPALFISRKVSDKFDGFKRFNFDYHDFNAKLTHLADERNKLWLSLYSGRDYVDALYKDEMSWAHNYEEDFTHLQWRKWNGTLGWHHQFTPTLCSDVMLVGTFNHNQMSIDNKSYYMEGGEIYRWALSNHKHNNTKMYDLGAKAHFDWQAGYRHRVQFGAQLMHHGFRPQSSELTYYYGDASEVDTTSSRQTYRTHSQELTAYIEDAINLSPRLSASVGTSLTLLKVKHRLYPMFDPRFSLDYRWSKQWTARLSCTHMSQSIHRLAPSLLALPTEFWVPSTAKVRPASSWQMTAGIHGVAPSGVMRYGIEGFYKQSQGLLTYRDWSGIQPVASRWESEVTSGRGRSWGFEADLFFDVFNGWGRSHPRHWILPDNYLQISYTLSWSQRHFGDIFDGWYPDQFDNRHKIDIVTHIKLREHITFTANWTYHTGNRLTLPEQFGFSPIVPGHDWSLGHSFIYGKPNNYALPAYHRLDLGMDFHHITKRGFERIWNVSVQNAYCHLNALFVEMRYNPWYNNTSQSQLSARSFGYIPIIPSFSYTLKF